MRFQFVITCQRKITFFEVFNQVHQNISNRSLISSVVSKIFFQISIQVNQSSTSKPSYNPTEYVTYNATTEYTSTTLSNELTTTAFDTSTTPNTLDKSSLSSTEGLDSERKGQDSEDEPPSIVIPFVVAGVALFCLVIVGVLVIACRRLNRYVIIILYLFRTFVY